MCARWLECLQSLRTAQVEGHGQKGGTSGWDAGHFIIVDRFRCGLCLVADGVWLLARRRYLVSVVDNDYVGGDLFSVLEAVPADLPSVNGNGAAANGGHTLAEPELLAA